MVKRGSDKRENKDRNTSNEEVLRKIKKLGKNVGKY